MEVNFFLIVFGYVTGIDPNFLFLDNLKASTPKMPYPRKRGTKKKQKGKNKNEREREKRGEEKRTTHARAPVGRAHLP